MLGATEASQAFKDDGYRGGASLFAVPRSCSIVTPHSTVASPHVDDFALLSHARERACLRIVFLTVFVTIQEDFAQLHLQHH